MFARILGIGWLLAMVLAACRTPGPCGFLEIEAASPAEWEPLVERWSEGRRADRRPGEDRAFYSRRAQLREVRRDLDADGRTDRWVYYIGDATPARAELDTDSDGSPDLWLRLGPGESVLEARIDSDASGQPDQTLRPDSVDLEALAVLPEPSALEPPPCFSVPDCMAYLEEVGREGFAAWRPTLPAKVALSYRIAANGCPYDVRVYAESSAQGRRECVGAIEDAAPFSPPPAGAVDLLIPSRCGY